MFTLSSWVIEIGVKEEFGIVLYKKIGKVYMYIELGSKVRYISIV